VVAECGELKGNERAAEDGLTKVLDSQSHHVMLLSGSIPTLVVMTQARRRTPMDDGHGVCAEIFPERVRMDQWGFPIIEDEDIPNVLVEHARRAVVGCPRMALHLLERRE